jgi:hypothetical protein
MISSIGGNGFKDAIERALDAVASDKVLRDVNWLGRKRKDKQKKGCHDMLFIKSILGIINFPICNICFSLHVQQHLFLWFVV